MSFDAELFGRANVHKGKQGGDPDHSHEVAADEDAEVEKWAGEELHERTNVTKHLIGRHEQDSHGGEGRKAHKTGAGAWQGAKTGAKTNAKAGAAMGGIVGGVGGALGGLVQASQLDGASAGLKALSALAGAASGATGGAIGGALIGGTYGLESGAVDGAMLGASGGGRGMSSDQVKRDVDTALGGQWKVRDPFNTKVGREADKAMNRLGWNG